MVLSVSPRRSTSGSRNSTRLGAGRQVAGGDAVDGALEGMQRLQGQASAPRR